MLSKISEGFLAYAFDCTEKMRKFEMENKKCEIERVLVIGLSLQSQFSVIKRDLLKNSVRQKIKYLEKERLITRRFTEVTQRFTEKEGELSVFSQSFRLSKMTY